jgi:hypothetical protein
MITNRDPGDETLEICGLRLIISYMDGEGKTYKCDRRQGHEGDHKEFMRNYSWPNLNKDET